VLVDVLEIAPAQHLTTMPIAWTGTSVATAALSGLAAQLWTHNPQLSPEQVIELITASGEPTTLADDLTGRTTVRRVSSHAAFASIGCRPASSR